MLKVIDRKQAADLLNVSIRTIDRYIHKGTLSKEEINGRIFIPLDDLNPLLEQKKIQNQYLSNLSSESKKQQSRHGRIKSAEPEAMGESAIDSSIEATYTDKSYPATLSTVSGGNDIYQKLYQELQEELKVKQERLEGANYRVGQLEGLLKESVPILEYRQALGLEEQKRQELESVLKNFEQQNELLSQTLDSKTVEIDQVSEKLATEKFNKKVFVIILVILFLLQPLWIIFPA